MGFIECIVLVVDLLILRACYKSYSSSKHAIKSLEGAPELPIDASLKSYVQQQKDEKVPYAVICGKVSAIEAPIKSAFSPFVTGVLQKIKIFEFKVVQGLARLWTNQRKLVDLEINEVPFMITNGKHGVEVTEALSAATLNLDIVYNSYEPSLLTRFWQYLGFFKEGCQITEEMLLEGSLMTAVGEIKFDAGILRLQPSSAGPFFLTTATKSEIIEKLKVEKIGAIIWGAITTVVLGIILRRWFFGDKDEKRKGRAEIRPEPYYVDDLWYYPEVSEPKKRKRRGNRSKKQPKANFVQKSGYCGDVSKPKKEKRRENRRRVQYYLDDDFDFDDFYYPNDVVDYYPDVDYDPDESFYYP